MIGKGKVSTISNDGKTVAVTPFNGEIVTADLVVPWYLIGLLAVGDPVIYTVFDDNTGIIIHKADGSGSCSCGSGGVSTTNEA